MSQENSQNSAISGPNPALKRLERLIGTWHMTGRTLTSDRDDFSGTSTFEWLPGGYFLQTTGTIEMPGLNHWSMEIIGYDETIDAFTSTLFTSMEGVTRVYHWDFQGDTLTHWEETSKYTGTISPDGNTISGGWRPREGIASYAGNTYDATMTRIK